MGYKIFVSYKYHDSSVYPLSSLYWNYNSFTTVRNYVDKFEQYLDRTSNISKTEPKNENLAYLSDNQIWECLKPRIYDSSVTIVFISPQMKDPYISERDQWIPWEIAYSLKETTRADRTSHSKAVLAVVLPDKSNSYSYYINPYGYSNGVGTGYYGDRVFSIIRKNMNNRIWHIPNSNGLYSISETDETSYIPSVSWNNFINNPMYYIECAIKRKENIYNYKICTEVK